MKIGYILLFAPIVFPISTFAAETKSEPPAQTTISVQFTEQDVQVIAASLSMASATCAQDSNGCQIGLLKGAILVKLQNALANSKLNKK